MRNRPRRYADVVVLDGPHKGRAGYVVGFSGANFDVLVIQTDGPAGDRPLVRVNYALVKPA